MLFPVIGKKYAPLQKTPYDVRTWPSYNVNCKKNLAGTENVVIKTTILRSASEIDEKFYER